MRYFVYHDNRIVGPLSPDEFQRLGGVEPDALVCAEGVSGRRDEDWRAAADVAELTGGLRSGLSTAVADEPLPGNESGLLERLELESLGVPRDGGDDWIAGFFDDAEFRTRWGFVLPKADDSPQQLSVAQNRILELSDQLRASQERLQELEAQQRDLLSQLRGNAQTEKLEPPRPPSLEAPASELAAAQNRIRELESQQRELLLMLRGNAQTGKLEPVRSSSLEAPASELSEVRSQIRKIEAQQRELLSLLRGNAQTEKLEPPRPPSLQPPAPPQAPFIEEEPPSSESPTLELPSIGIRREEVVIPPVGEVEAPPVEFPAHAARRPETEFQKRAFKFTPPKPPTHAPKLGLPKFGPIKSFRVVKKEDSAAAASGTPIYEWNVSSQTQSAGLPEAKKVEPLVPSSEVAPAASGPSFAIPPLAMMSLNPPTPVAPPPVTMQFTLPPQPSLGGPTMPSFGAPPIPTPTLTPLTPEYALPAAGYMGPSVAASGSVLTPSRSNSEPFAAAQTPATDVMKRLAKPETPKTVEKPKERSYKVFYAASGVLVLILLASFAFFLRSPKDLKLMMNMGADHKPLGATADDADLKNQVFMPKAPEAPAPTPASAPAPVAPPDQGEAAKELVKNYPLDADRGTVAQRLSFMFMAEPGGENKEEWTAGAVEADIYIVQYRAIPGPNSKSKEAISYVFEANLAHGTVKGNNPQARELLGGPSAPPKPQKKPRPAPRRRLLVKRAPAPPKEVPLMPLPSDSELLPPAEGDSQFKADTVR